MLKLASKIAPLKLITLSFEFKNIFLQNAFKNSQRSLILSLKLDL